ncbi:MAG: methyl-accepting chemotaxis protein [Thalassotalea sp.]
MPNRLSIKLLIPQIMVALITIIVVLLFSESLSASGFFWLMLLAFAVQITSSFILNNQKLDKRFDALSQYLKLVVSIDQAPDKPLKDNSGDQLGQITNQLSEFVTNLGDVLDELKGESEMLHQGSAQLSAQMKESVKSVDASTNQIEQMADSIELVASTSTVLSNNAAQVSETTSQVIGILAQGTDSSNTSQLSIESFANEVTSMANDLSLLQGESARIGSVLDVIRGIADQTNLLALNAAIEAARAGEQGRGFAVVADEVRALAHRTQEATVEIQSMVEGLQEKSSNAVSAISRGQDLTQESLAHSAEVVAALEKIKEVFQEVDALTSQIASGTDEQQHSTASLNENMSAVVAISRELNQGLIVATQHADQQRETSEQVDSTLSRICV